MPARATSRPPSVSGQPLSPPSSTRQRESPPFSSRGSSSACRSRSPSCLWPRPSRGTSSRSPSGFGAAAGSATAIGAFLWLTGVEIAAGRFSPVSLGALLFVALLLYLASRNGDATGLVVFLFMGLVTPLELGITGVSVLAMALSAFLLASILQKSIAHGLFRNERGIELKPWRLVARPFALLFIPIDVLWGRRALLFVIGAVSLASSAWTSSAS